MLGPEFKSRRRDVVREGGIGWLEVDKDLTLLGPATFQLLMEKMLIVANRSNL